MSPARLRVLVVEDEMTIALLIEDMLTDLGHDVVDLAMRLPRGLELAGVSDMDLAILDVNLDGHRSYPIAETLMRRNVPYIFVTGYGELGIDPAYRNGAIVVQKPFDIEDLRQAIDRLAAAGGASETTD